MNKFINRYIKLSFLIAVIITPFLLFFENPKPLITGMYFGLIIRLLMFKLSAIDLGRTLSMPANKAKSSARLNYGKRFLFYGLALAISAKSEYLSIYTCSVGLLILSWSIQIANFIDIYKSHKSKKQWF